MSRFASLAVVLWVAATGSVGCAIAGGGHPPLASTIAADGYDDKDDAEWVRKTLHLAVAVLRSSPGVEPRYHVLLATPSLAENRIESH